MIDHSLLHPTMTDKDLFEGCQLAKHYNIATVCIKPYTIKEAVEWLKGSDVMVCAVIVLPFVSEKLYDDFGIHWALINREAAALLPYLFTPFIFMLFNRTRPLTQAKN